MYKNVLFSKATDIAINLLTSPVTVEHGGPFGQTKTQICDTNHLNSGTNVTTSAAFFKPNDT